MAKSLRSKVKKRLRTVKRGILKRELATEGSKMNVREVQKEEKLLEALSGHLKPPVNRKNAFRSDDPDAEIPQHNFRQGPDFRSGYAGTLSGVGFEDAGYAVVGSNRPKHPHGSDAPTAPAVLKPVDAMEAEAQRVRDVGVVRLLRGSEQIVPKYASKSTRRRLKNKSGIDHDAPHRWT
jgi:hypothetical protein